MTYDTVSRKATFEGAVEAVNPIPWKAAESDVTNEWFINYQMSFSFGGYLLILDCSFQFDRESHRPHLHVNKVGVTSEIWGEKMGHDRETGRGKPQMA